MDEKLAEALIKTEEGQALARYLHSLINDLDRISGINFADPQEATIEMKARQRAAEKLSTALKTLLTAQPRGTVKSENNPYEV